MKQSISLLITCLILSACSTRTVDKKTTTLLPTEDEPNLVEVAQFKGAQVTGVTVASDGRMFANFPRWRSNIPFSVVEIKDGKASPYPNKEWNKWSGKQVDNQFTCVQSVFAHGNSLFVLDPASPKMEGVVGNAKLFEFDLSTDKIKRIYNFRKDVAPKQSYLNDLRVDDQAQKIYITDSGMGGLVVLDMVSGNSERVLADHPSTKAEPVILSVESKPFLMKGKPAKIHSDGIALSPDNKKLYYHALTGYHLYSVPTESLGKSPLDANEVLNKITDVGVTPAPDGMIFDQQGNLYMADLERNAVAYRTPRGDMKILIQDERIKWPDTFTIDQENNLVFTDSLLQAAGVGDQVDNMTFKIYKVALPQ